MREVGEVQRGLGDPFTKDSHGSGFHYIDHTASTSVSFAAHLRTSGSILFSSTRAGIAYTPNLLIPMNNEYLREICGAN